MGRGQYPSIQVEKMLYVKNEKFLLRLMWHVRRRFGDDRIYYVAAVLENGCWSANELSRVSEAFAKSDVELGKIGSPFGMSWMASVRLL